MTRDAGRRSRRSASLTILLTSFGRGRVGKVWKMADPFEGVARDATTLAEVITGFEAEGYTGQFIARDGGLVECTKCKTRTPASTVTADHRLRRLEGASDPADMLAVAALTCPSCGTRGTLVLNYGAEAGRADDEVLQALDLPPEDPDEHEV
jgi:hypothetical protein